MQLTPLGYLNLSIVGINRLINHPINSQLTKQAYKIKLFF